MNIIFPTNNFV